ncbi:MAG TPA: type VI secretion system baseplate subunit TssE [Sedimentisphaerales bacterium]|nr:type VI secretion system baseplate subunit TssE [Sedimentisphaerales bacterium]
MDRLQPCLLDRLTDDEPDVQKESRDQRIVSVRRYKAAVLRDLGMLLNAKANPLGEEIYEFDEAARSVLNYGIPDLCGTTLSAERINDFESQVKHAMQCFEPRISRRSLSVRMVSPADVQNIRTVSFEIEGELWAQPLPDHLYVKTEVDLESGHHVMRGEPNG